MAVFTSALRSVRELTFDLLPIEALNQLARDGGLKFRQRTLPPGMTLRCFIQQVAAGNIACSAVHHLAVADFSDTAWCQARARLPITLIRTALRQVVDAARDELSQTDQVGSEPYRWHGHRVHILDGSSDSMPDTPPLRAHYGVHSACRPGLGFPISHLLFLLDQRSGLLIDCLDDPMNTHDLSQAPAMHRHLAAGDIVLGDDVFSGYAHLALVLRHNLHAIVPVHHKRIVDFTPDREHVPRHRNSKPSSRGKVRSRIVKVLGKDDQLVEYFKPISPSPWISPQQWDELAPSIVVREIRRTIQRDGFRPITVTIVTTLLDPMTYPADELIDLRLTRWMIETNIRHLKTTLGMDVLKCKTLEGVRKERLIFLLVYNLIRMLMLQAARQQRVNVHRLSFADTLAWVRLSDCCCIDGDEMPPRIKINPLRPGRLEPRKLKRQKKQYAYMTQPRDQFKSQLRARYCLADNTA